MLKTGRFGDDRCAVTADRIRHASRRGGVGGWDDETVYSYGPGTYQLTVPGNSQVTLDVWGGRRRRRL